MTFTPKEVILGATVPLENGGAITFSIAGHVEAERDYDDAVVIFGRKLLKYTNCATDADRLTVRQVVASITSTPLDKVPDVGTPTPPAPVKEPAKVAPPVAAPAPVMGPAPTAAEQAAAAVAQCIKPPATAPDPAPSAPPTPEASAPAAAASAAPKTAPQPGVVCVNCGAAVSASQAKLSQLFQSKTLCKSCMEATAPRPSDPRFRDARRGPGTARALDSADL
jgi:hypothetical protein